MFYSQGMKYVFEILHSLVVSARRLLAIVTQVANNIITIIYNNNY